MSRMEGSDPKPAGPLPNMVPQETILPPLGDDKTIAQAALEVFRDDLEDPDAVQAEIDAMSGPPATTIPAATVITPEGAVADAVTGEKISEPPKKHWKPSSGDFITLRGKGNGTYLPARKRINWMRGGDPDAHPDWGINTALLEHNQGKRAGAGRIEGGYALVAASITDERGRVIATAMKTEYSENFADYVEKAETGAVARALAVAGYGTESALDLDEGYDQDRLADAPAKSDGRPISISSSGGVEGVRQGGRQTKITAAQKKAITDEVKRIGIGPDKLGKAIENLLDIDVPTKDGPSVEAAVDSLSFDNAGKLVQALHAADPEEGGDEGEEEDDSWADDSDEDGDPVGAK
jgi:hypothetical protein